MSSNIVSILIDPTGSFIGVPSGTYGGITGGPIVAVLASPVSVGGLVNVQGSVVAHAGTGSFVVTSTGSLPVVVTNFPVTQSVFVGNTVPVSGSVFVTTTGSLPVSVQGTVPVSMSNTPVVTIGGSPTLRPVSIFGVGSPGTPAGGVVSVQATTGSTPFPVMGSIVANAGSGTFATSGSFGLQDSSGRQIVIGSSLTGSVLSTAPFVIAGLQSGIVRAIQTDVSGAVYVTASGSFRVTGSVEIAGSVAVVGGNTPSTAMVCAGSDGVTTRILSTDSQGRLVIAPAGTTSTTSGFSSGYVNTAATTQVTVRATAYSEVTSNAQRSIASANANDTSAGTGARTVRITYFDSTGAGPYTETVTLNGTSYVNTTNSNICFIENIEVITAGSGGKNAGVITLKAATAGGGATIGTINAGENRPFWAHHYVPTGKTCSITSVSVGHNGTTVGSGGVYVIKSIAIGSNQAEIQESDFIRLYGQSSTISRNYGTPIKVVGPAKVTLYVTPESSTSLIYRGSFDFYDE